jgi:hypothetical protein
MSPLVDKFVVTPLVPRDTLVVSTSPAPKDPTLTAVEPLIEHARTQLEQVICLFTQGVRDAIQQATELCASVQHGETVMFDQEDAKYIGVLVHVLAKIGA